jgi:hypothetical protein
MIEISISRWDRGEVGTIALLALPPRDARDLLGHLPNQLATGLISQLLSGLSEGRIGSYRWRRTA